MGKWRRGAPWTRPGLPGDGPEGEAGEPVPGHDLASCPPAGGRRGDGAHAVSRPTPVALTPAARNTVPPAGTTTRSGSGFLGARLQHGEEEPAGDEQGGDLHPRMRASHSVPPERSAAST